MVWTNEQAYAMWKATLKGDEGNCAAWRADKGNAYYDRGGLTHWGVTRNTWIAFAQKHGWDPSKEAQCSMTEAQFETITRAYWRNSGAVKIPYPGVAILAAMMVWGTGAIYPLQRALRKQGFNISVDGVFGPQTLAAIETAKPELLIRDIKPDWHNTLMRTTHSRYHTGLSNRVERIYVLVNAAQLGWPQVEYSPGKVLSVPKPQKETKANWVAVLAGGVLVGVGSFFGYRYYKRHQRSGQ